MNTWDIKFVLKIKIIFSIFLIIILNGCSCQNTVLLPDIACDEFNKYKVTLASNKNKIEVQPIEVGLTTINIKVNECEILNQELLLKGLVYDPSKTNGFELFGLNDTDIYTCEFINGNKCVRIKKNKPTTNQGLFSITIPYKRNIGLLFYNDNFGGVLLTSLELGIGVINHCNH